MCSLFSSMVFFYLSVHYGAEDGDQFSGHLLFLFLINLLNIAIQWVVFSIRQLVSIHKTFRNLAITELLLFSLLLCCDARVFLMCVFCVFHFSSGTASFTKLHEKALKWQLRNILFHQQCDCRNEIDNGTQYNVHLLPNHSQFSIHT